MYIKRYIFEQVKEKLDEDDILLIIGARQTGKTTLLNHLREELEKDGKSCYFFNVEEKRYTELFDETPLNLFNLIPIDLNKKTYVFMDEIQYLKDPTNFLKLLYDNYRGKVKLIVSGSSSFYIDKKFKDSLVGRKYIFTLSPMSLKEFIEFKEGNDILVKRMGVMTLTEKDKVISCCNEYSRYGGYPKVVLADTHEKKLAALGEIAYTYTKKDILDAGLRSDSVYYDLFRLLAHQAGSMVSYTELSSALSTSQKTIKNYLYVMRKSFQIALIEPFYNNVRKEVTKMPKVYFIDLGLRNYFMENFDLYATRVDKGAILENLAFRMFYDKIDYDINIRY